MSNDVNSSGDAQAGSQSASTHPIFSLLDLSNQTADLVRNAAPFIVRVDDGSRLTATGVVWTNDGVIVTTSHGLERDDDLSIETYDGGRYPAALVGRDPESDLAVLKVDAPDLAAAPRANADQVLVGQIVLALGRPGNNGLQATLGLITARLEAQNDGAPEYILHTDAVLYPGFSGGPLIAADGAVVAIANRMFGRGSGVGLGVSLVDQVVQTLLTYGSGARGYLGVRTHLVEIPASLKSLLTVEQEYGLLVVQVEPESPAESAGLLLGDTLLSIDHAPLHDIDAFRRKLRAGRTISISLLRGGQLHALQATVAAIS